jgi:hypothetical protein
MSANGTIDMMTKSIQGVVGKDVVIEATNAPKAVRWHINTRPYGPDELPLVMKHLEEQTGLTYVEEKRKVKRLVLKLPTTP